jgi:hypothetical protein
VAPSSPPAYERETVREFQPQESVVSQPTPASNAGYAREEPVRMEWPSDLQQVESDPTKIQAIRHETVQEQPAPRPKRVRPTSSPVNEEPLVQIETGASGSSNSGGEKTSV